MPGASKSGIARRALHVALDRLARLFDDTGAETLDLPFLYPAEALLDLYGEDLRSRAFVYGDAERGDELCLRLDFTVPVAMHHRAGGWERAAAYTYQGPVFRRQPANADRPVEYLQAGVERFGDCDIAGTDAAVFLTLRSGLVSLGIQDPVATLGDLSIVLAVLDALDMPEHRRAALKRHLWRPVRFQDLIERACQPDMPGTLRQQAFSATPDALRAMIHASGDDVGLRDIADVTARLASLKQRMSDTPMPDADARLISAVLKVRGPADAASVRIRDLTQAAGLDISETLERFDARLSLLLEQGCPAESLMFDAGFGRSLEYYDGFVFELRASGGDVHPPLAGGGRYDAMTVRLGADAPVPAVGGILRPEAVLEVLA